MKSPWFADIFERGGDLTDVVHHAQSLARVAFQESDALGNLLDKHCGSAFRQNLLEPLLRKERELEALRERELRGGPVRTSDRGNLGSLVTRRQTEYQSIVDELQAADLAEQQKTEVDAYLDARRRQLFMGDAERVRNTVREFLAEAAIAI